MADVKLETPAEKQARTFQQYIQNKKIVIVDSQSYTRAALGGTLSQLGAPAMNTRLCSNFEDGRAAIAEACPDLLFAEFDLDGGRCGLDLLVEQRRAGKAEAKKSLFFLVTGNNSQAAVAKAAEEDVDGYILKPYTLDGLRNSIMRHALIKLYPGDYVRTIEAGKKQLLERKFDEALKTFEQAMTQDPKPALACFYHAQTELLKQAAEKAEKDYGRGLEFNKIHYKCMVGLFDLLMERERTKEAYEIVRRISRYFPANPDRLATVLRLAVVNGAFEDIERYYQLFCKLDQRNETLIRYVCAALLVCGRYYLQSKQPGRALELFNKAKSAGFGRPKVLREIISSLLQYGMATEAQRFLVSYPSDQLTSEAYKALEFVVTEGALELGVSIARGRELLQAGVKDPLLHAVMIERSVQAGYTDHAQQLLVEALAFWPAQRAEFEACFSKPRPRKS